MWLMYVDGFPFQSTLSLDEPFFPEESSPWPQPHCTNPTNLCMTTGAYCSISRSSARQKVPGQPRFIEFVHHFFQTKNNGNHRTTKHGEWQCLAHTNGEEEETCFGLKIKENGDLPTESLVLKLDEIWMLPVIDDVKWLSSQQIKQPQWSQQISRYFG